MKKEDSPLCDFGQYQTLWGHHKESCKKIVRITGDYIIYIDRNHNIDWETTEEYDSRITGDEKATAENVLSHCLISEQKPTGGLSDESILSFKNIVGEAIVNCLERNGDGATEILRQADEFRVDRVVEKSREWHLTFTMLISAVLILIALLLNSKIIPIRIELLPYINVGAWAISGACLSIILRSGNLQHASYAGKQLHFIESGGRLIGGFITGQMVYLGIKSGILFSSLVGDNGNSQYIIIFLALLAGASGRFAPSIITKVDNPSLKPEVAEEN